jgi:enoyl-CoA hydratase
VRALREGGVPEADRRTPALVGPLFESEDLRRAVDSFLEQGPGKATFEGR